MIMSDVPGESNAEGTSDSDSISQYQDTDDKEPQVRAMTLGLFYLSNKLHSFLFCYVATKRPKKNFQGP